MVNINYGTLNEVPDVCIDSFKTVNWEKNHLFFLTHAHTDHLDGILYSLPGNNFLRKLLKHNNQKQNHYKFYMHKHTYHFLIFHLKRRNESEAFTDLEKLKEEEVIMFLVANERRQLDTKGFKELWVTPLSSGHCVGSLMFYFEILPLSTHTPSNTELERKTRVDPYEKILFTGDCRIHDKDMQKILDILQMEPNYVDILYIDTTFCSTIYEEFPSQKSSIDTLIKFIDENESCQYFLSMAGYLTRMPVIPALQKRFQEKVCVGQFEHEFCEAINSKLKDKTVQTDSCYSSSTPCDYRFHVENCSCNLFETNSRKLRKQDNWCTVVFKASAPIYSPTKSNFHCQYSTHLSYNEIQRVIHFFKPEIVKPLCIPFDSILNDYKFSYKKMNKESLEYKDKLIEETDRITKLICNLNNAIKYKLPDVQNEFNEEYSVFYDYTSTLPPL